MTTINVNTIEPSGSTLTVGESGDTIIVPEVKVDTLKDAGGNTLFVSNGSGVLSSVNSGFGGALNLLSTQTASDSATISFTSGIDSTYKEYVFKFININPATNDSNFGFQVNATGEYGYNETITSTTFRAYHREDDGGTPALAYNTGTDQAQGTALQPLSFGQSNAADANMSGELHLFNPSSTTYVKNFFGTTNNLQNADYTEEQFTAGYINVTAAVTNVQFSMSSGNFDGTIKMYGIS